MSMPKELADAYAAAEHHIAMAMANHNKLAAERVELGKCSKEELIEQLLSLKYSATGGKRAIKVEDLAYAILGDPACAFLTYSMIAAVIADHAIPGVQTKAGNLQYYASKSIEKQRGVVPRATKAAINKLILQTAAA